MRDPITFWGITVPLWYFLVIHLPGVFQLGTWTGRLLVKLARRENKNQ